MDALNLVLDDYYPTDLADEARREVKTAIVSLRTIIEAQQAVITAMTDEIIELRSNLDKSYGWVLELEAYNTEAEEDLGGSFEGHNPEAGLYSSQLPRDMRG